MARAALDIARPGREERLAKLLSSAHYSVSSEAATAAPVCMPAVSARTPLIEAAGDRTDNKAEAQSAATSSRPQVPPKVVDAAAVGSGPELRKSGLIARACTLPIGRDADAQRARKDLFQRWDPNGNGVLSLAEVDKGLCETLGSDSQVAKPAINRAFHAARRLKPPVHDFDDNYIDWNEFRVFLAYVEYYIGLWKFFSHVDTNGDRRVTFKEFEAVLPVLAEWGAAGIDTSPEAAEAAFRRMDKDGGGMVLFDEFAHWALEKGLGNFADDQADDRSEALALLRKQRPNLSSMYDDGGGDPTPGTSTGDVDSLPSTSAVCSARASLSAAPGTETCQRSSELVTRATLLPVGRDVESQTQRRKLFSQWDPNGNGILSLAEVDKGLREILGPTCETVKPAIDRAFHAARQIAPPVHSFDDDYIDWNEFRVFLVYVTHYLELLSIFQEADANGDRRMSLKEFESACRSTIFAKWGHSEMSSLGQDSFHALDQNRGGFVLFDEFAHWALGQGLGDLADDHPEERAEALALLRERAPNLANQGERATGSKSSRQLGASAGPGSSQQAGAVCGGAAAKKRCDEQPRHVGAGHSSSRSPCASGRRSTRSVSCDRDPRGSRQPSTQASPRDGALPGQPPLRHERRGSVHQEGARRRPPVPQPTGSAVLSGRGSSSSSRPASALRGAGVAAVARPESTPREGSRRECTCSFCPSCRRRMQSQYGGDVKEAIRLSLLSYEQDQEVMPSSTASANLSSSSTSAGGGQQQYFDGRAPGPAYDRLLGGSSLEEQSRMLTDIAEANRRGLRPASTDLRSQGAASTVGRRTPRSTGPQLRASSAPGRPRSRDNPIGRPGSGAPAPGERASRQDSSRQSRPPSAGAGDRITGTQSSTRLQQHTTCTRARAEAFTGVRGGAASRELLGF